MTKHCTRCGYDLPLTNFHLDRSNRDGLSSKCKDCERTYNRNRRQYLAMKERLRHLKSLEDELIEEDVGQWIDRRRRSERYDDEAMEGE